MNIKKWEEDGCPTHPVALFAEAVAMTRNSCHGVGVIDIAKCLKKQLSDAEIDVLIMELSY
jgi:hypothetical protein